MMGGPPAGKTEVGDTVASFPTYEAAQKAVSALISGDVPARDIAIVGTGLRSIERVTGRLGYAAAARSGAINGVLLGLLFSAIFVLGTPDVALQLFIGVMFVGIAIGMLMSIIAYSLVRRRRDYASVTQVAADHYELTVLPSSIHRAREILGRPAETPVPRPVTEPVERPADPPRYGERIDESPAPTPDFEAPSRLETPSAPEVPPATQPTPPADADDRR